MDTKDTQKQTYMKKHYPLYDYKKMLQSRVGNPMFKADSLRSAISYAGEVNVLKEFSSVKRIRSIVPLLTKAIKTIDLNKSKYKARILGSP